MSVSPEIANERILPLPGAIGYVAGFGASALVFMVLTVLTIFRASPHSSAGTAFVVCALVITEIVPAFLAMILPWYVVVGAGAFLPAWRGMYFTVLGATVSFLVECATTAVAPVPLFIENQTFWEAAGIAAERQGLAFLVSGATFGLLYWLISDRGRPPA